MMSLGLGGDLVAGEGQEVGLMFGETAVCLVGSRELAVGKTRAGRRTPGQLQERPSPLSFGPGPFFLQELPHGGAAPVSPQQSGCSPVGALQVGCILIPPACLPSLVPGAVGEADRGQVPCSQRLSPTHLPSLLL